MSEQKKKLSALCLTGFILSILPVFWLVTRSFSRYLPGDLETAYNAYIIPATLTLLPLTGLIISIAGLVTASKNGKKGKGFAIAGIVLPGTGLTIVVAVLAILFFLMGSSDTSKKIRNNEMYQMGPLRDAVNTEYDVSSYRMPKEIDFKSLNITISETELNTYAESKLEKISKKTDKSIRGTRQGYNFLIVRSDCYDEWLSTNLPQIDRSYYDGYNAIGYADYWEFGATKIYPLAIYKDPSDKFVIITNCSDYRIISEFFKAD